jgi:hypothetical protein
LQKFAQRDRPLIFCTIIVDNNGMMSLPAVRRWSSATSGTEKYVPAGRKAVAIRKHLLPTTVVGSYPQPDWLVDRAMLSKSVPRTRMTEMWRIPDTYLEQAQDDATIVAIRDMERAGIDVFTDGEIRRESYSNRFARRPPPTSLRLRPERDQSYPPFNSHRRFYEQIFQYASATYRDFYQMTLS